MRPLEKEILKTLAYTDIFDYPLTKPQIWRFLIKNTWSWSQFNKTLERLKQKKYIRKIDTYYLLYGRQKIIQLRRQREQVAHTKIAYGQKISRLLKFIPTVWFIGISGALAMHNAPHDDDIDFFTICAPGTVWLTRFLATTLLDILKLRRKPGIGKWQNKICLNMFMDAADMALKKSERNLYTAHEVVQLLLLFDRHQTYERFLHENRWTRRYLPNASHVPKKETLVPLKVWWKLVFPIETIFYFLQLLYMKKRITTEQLSRTVIRFHPKDIKVWVLEEYKKRVSTLS